jgi:hypothetical protein
LLQAHSTLAESFFFTNTLEFTGLCFWIRVFLP